MNDQENQQEDQDSGQGVAEVQQEAPATSENADPQVHASEASAPPAQGSSEAGQEAPVENAQAQADQTQEAQAPQEAQAHEAPVEAAAPVQASPDDKPAGQDEKKDEKKDFGQILAEFEGDAPKSEAPAAGQKVKGKVLSITDEWVFLDLGGKAEGRIAAADLKDAEGNLTVKEGRRRSTPPSPAPIRRTAPCCSAARRAAAARASGRRPRSRPRSARPTRPTCRSRGW